jgi:hypothetical protein
MSEKLRLTFKIQRTTADDWEIVAEGSRMEPRHLKGFKRKAEVDEWLNGSRRIYRLKSQGLAK